MTFRPRCLSLEYGQPVLAEKRLRQPFGIVQHRTMRIDDGLVPRTFVLASGRVSDVHGHERAGYADLAGRTTDQNRRIRLVSGKSAFQTFTLPFTQDIIDIRTGIGSGPGFPAATGIEQNGSSGDALQCSCDLASVLGGLHA